MGFYPEVGPDTRARVMRFYSGEILPIAAAEPPLTALGQPRSVDQRESVKFATAFPELRDRNATWKTLTGTCSAPRQAGQRRK
jgi:hypothetical protein